MIHLWFLPFAFVAGYVLAPLRSRSNLALLVPLVVAVFVAVAPQNLAIPFPQWLFGAVPAVVGAAFFAQEGNRRYLAIVSLFLAFLVLEIFRPQQENLIVLIGSAIALVAFMIDVKATDFTNFAAQISLPIYLAHPLFLFLGKVCGLENIALASAGVIGSVLFGFTQSILLSKILRK
jgi:hypothetical protein